ncbi:MAG: hypothetical protein ACOC3C_04240, partial [Candidatus Thorarchaeota archaeon]
AAPTISGPADFSFENGSLGETITWNTTASDPKNYSVTRDGEVYEEDDWDGSNITIDLDHLYEENLTYSVPVSFDFECTVFNIHNESASDSVVVTVIADEAAPVVEVSSNFGDHYEEGSFGHKLTWQVNETNPDFYNITRQSNWPSDNFTTIESGEWEEGNISVSVDGLNATHWYEYTIFLNDTLGHNTTSSFNFTVFPDLSNPEISSPDDISYEFGSSGHKLTWHIYDSNPANYSLTVLIFGMNETYGNVSKVHDPPSNITGQEWTLQNPKGDNLSFMVDDMYLGNYSFNLTLFDAYGRNASDVVNVTVYRDVRAPIINATDDLDYEEGYTGYDINWTVDESNPRFFNLTRNDTILNNGTWRGENFSMNVDGLSVGAHQYNLTLTDFFNQTSFEVITVTVTPDAHDPAISEVRTILSYNGPASTNLSVQAYVWDLNNISSVTIEWGVDKDNPENDTMETEEGHLYFSHLGAFDIGEEIWYRINGTDNSSVNNVGSTGWRRVEIKALRQEPLPPLIWGTILGLGLLSMLVVALIYFRTR